MKNAYDALCPHIFQALNYQVQKLARYASNNWSSRSLKSAQAQGSTMYQIKQNFNFKNIF